VIARVFTLLRALFSFAGANEIVRFVCSRVRRWGDSSARTLVIWEGEVVAALGEGVVRLKGERLLRISTVFFWRFFWRVCWFTRSHADLRGLWRKGPGLVEIRLGRLRGFYALASSILDRSRGRDRSFCVLAGSSLGRLTRSHARLLGERGGLLAD
jgi:hypothetical protein